MIKPRQRLDRINEYPSFERVKGSAEARRGAASSSWCACTRTRPSLNLNDTLPWGWICVCRRCRCGSPSCGGPTASSDDAVDAAPCFHDQDYRPHSRYSLDDHPRCCSSGPPPADFYTHTHTTLFMHAFLRTFWRPWPPDMHIPRTHTHVWHVLQRTTL